MERSTLGLSPQLCAYLHDNNPAEHEAMRGLRKATASLPEARFQISLEQACLLQFLVRLTGARNSLEIGTYTGYSALAVALALPSDGRLTCCDVSTEWTDVGQPFWEAAGVAAKIDLRIAPAVDTLHALLKEGAHDFDFVFIDADKDNYDSYYEVCLRLLRTGGVIVLDNMLRRGRVVDPDIDDPDARIVQMLNRKIAQDERVDRVLIAVADGMTLVRKR